MIWSFEKCTVCFTHSPSLKTLLPRYVVSCCAVLCSILFCSVLFFLLVVFISLRYYSWFNLLSWLFSEDYPRNTPPSADNNRERERGTPTYDSSIETRRFSAHDEDKRIITELTYRISRLEQKLHDKDNSESSERKENNERREVVERKVRKVDQTDLERKVNYLVSDVSELSEQVTSSIPALGSTRYLASYLSQIICYM